jgi:hypothetical protein
MRPLPTWLLSSILLTAILAASLLYYTTATFGAGVGTDGAIYASTADSLLHGRGLVDYSGTPLVRWPPLYPLLIAVAGAATGQAALPAAWGLNIILFIAIILLGSLLTIEANLSSPLWTLVAALFLGLSPSLLRLCASVGSDPIFIVLTQIWLIASARYGKTRSKSSLAMMSLTAGLAWLARVPGVTLMFAGLILIIWAKVGAFSGPHPARSALRAILPPGLIYTLAASLPFSAWVLIHNYLEHHILLGNVTSSNNIYPSVNLQREVQRVAAWWISPDWLLGNLRPAILAAAALIALAAIILLNRSSGLGGFRLRLKQLARRFLQPLERSSMVLSLVYLSFLALTVNSRDTNFPFYDRYETVILAPVLVLVCSSLDEWIAHPLASLLQNRPKVDRSWAKLAGLLIFAAWALYPLTVIYPYVQITRTLGEPTYNLYNTLAIRSSSLVIQMRTFCVNPSTPVYSNYPARAWFLLDRPVNESPGGTVADELNIPAVMQSNRGWPGQRPGCLV